MHSRKYGWTLNVKKTLVIIFGTPAQRAALAHERFYWGAELLQRAETVKYLGVHLYADLSWRVHVALSAKAGPRTTRGRQSLPAPGYMWRQRYVC